MSVARYLFHFGYEDPAERQSNAQQCTDFESSAEFWIEAPSEADALAWGTQVAEAFVRYIFERADQTPYSWIEANFAHWFDASSDSAEISFVPLGAMPDFATLVRE